MRRRGALAALLAVLAACGPGAAIAQDPAAATGPWRFFSVERFSPTCVPGLGATMAIEPNAVVYTFPSPAVSGQQWRVRLKWTDPVLGGPNGTTVSAHVEATVEAEGPPGGPIPSLRMIMFVDPPGYTVHNADVGLSAGVGARVSVGDDFEASANPDFTQPFDVKVWFMAHYCDNDSRELVRYRFNRTVDLPGAASETGSPSGPDPAAVDPACLVASAEYQRLEQEQTAKAREITEILDEIALVDAEIEKYTALVKARPDMVDDLFALTLGVEHYSRQIKLATAQRELAAIQAQLGRQASILVDGACPDEPEPGAGDAGQALFDDPSRQAPNDLMCLVTHIRRNALEEREGPAAIELAETRKQLAIVAGLLDVAITGGFSDEGVRNLRTWHDALKDRIAALETLQETLLRGIGEATLTLEDLGC
jgi:hypothetical protein